MTERLNPKLFFAHKVRFAPRAP